MAVAFIGCACPVRTDGALCIALQHGRSAVRQPRSCQGTRPRQRPLLVLRCLAQQVGVDGARLQMAEQLQATGLRSEEHTSELQSPCNLVCRLLLEKTKK